MVIHMDSMNPSISVLIAAAEQPQQQKSQTLQVLPDRAKMGGYQPSLESMDWFKGKSTGNHGFYHQI